MFNRSIALCLFAMLLTFYAPSASPSEFNPDVASRLQDLLDDYPVFSGDDGVALSLSRDTQQYDGYSGWADRAASIPVSAATQFRAGSNTKMVLTIIAMQLVEEGRLALDETLEKYLSVPPSWRAITVRQVLGMRSGIPEYIGARWPLLSLALMPHRARSTAEMLDYAKGLPLEFAPGTSCNYSNSNYLAIGLIVESITGQSVAELVTQRVVKPLGLQASFMDISGKPIPTLAHGKLDVVSAASLLGQPKIFYYLFGWNERLGDGVVDSTYHFHPSIMGPAGALVSTPADMAVILRALLAGDLVSATSLAAMIAMHPCKVLGAPVEYGLGMQRLPSTIGPLLGHVGVTFGFRSTTFYHPGLGLTLSIMSNAVPDQHAGLIELLLREVTTPQRPQPQSCVPPSGFGVVDRGRNLSIKFRGVAGEAWLRGVGTAELRHAGQLRRLHLSGMTSRLSDDRRLLVRSLSTLAPGATRQTRLEVSLPLAALTQQDTDELDVRMEELSIDGQQHVVRSCLQAVIDSDASHTGEFSRCGSEPLQLGDNVAFFLRTRLSEQAQHLRAYLQAHGRSAACQCFDTTGQAIPCSS